MTYISKAVTLFWKVIIFLVLLALIQVPVVSRLGERYIHYSNDWMRILVFCVTFSMILMLCLKYVKYFRIMLAYRLGR